MSLNFGSGLFHGVGVGGVALPLESITAGCQAESIRPRVTLISRAGQWRAQTRPALPRRLRFGEKRFILSLVGELSPASSLPPTHYFCFHTSHLLTPGLRRPVGHLSGEPALAGCGWAPHQPPCPRQAVLERVPEKQEAGTRARLLGVACRTPAGPGRPRRDGLATGKCAGEPTPSLRHPSQLSHRSPRFWALTGSGLQEAVVKSGTCQQSQSVMSTSFGVSFPHSGAV